MIIGAYGYWRVRRSRFEIWRLWVWVPPDQPHFRIAQLQSYPNQTSHSNFLQEGK